MNRERSTREEGSVLLVTLILVITFGGLVTASLSMMVSENKKISRRHLANQVEMQAHGQLEVAKNIVNAASYDVFMQNRALLDAINDPNGLIADTDVTVSRVGSTEYFVLRTEATVHGITKRAEAIVRQVSPASSNNLMVIDHPVGLSGAPRGAIHSNKYIDFYFPGGNYRDQVTAVAGFNFVSGASIDNTTFGGPVNQNAPVSNPLKDVNFDDLWAEADVLSVTENLIAEIKLKGTTAEVKLFRPAHKTVEPIVKTSRVFSHMDTEEYIDWEPVNETYNYTVSVPVYVDEAYVEVTKVPVYGYRDATREIQEPILVAKVVHFTVDVPVYSTRTVQVPVKKDVWVSYETGTTSSSGGTVGSTTGAAGYWKSVTEMEDRVESYISGYTKQDRTRTDQVLTGYKTIIETYRQRYIDHYDDVDRNRVRKVLDHWEDVVKTGTRTIDYTPVTRYRSIKVYKDVTETVMKTVQHGEKFVRTENVPLSGTMYLKGDVRKLSGKINGRLSLITAGSVKLTGDVTYIDDNDKQRMLNGKDHTLPYEENPDYTGDSLLAVMAKGDVLYSVNAPKDLEINASLISAEGSVKFEGIEVSTDGATVWTQYVDGKPHVLDSLRRLGGIVSAKRPICTYIDERGFISAGFEHGESIMDQNLILSSGNNNPPPFMFESGVPNWIMSTSGMSLGVVQ